MTLDVTRPQAADETGADSGSSRRAVLRAAGVGGAAVAVGITAAACSSSSNSNTSSGDNPASGASGGGSSASSGSGGSAALAQTADIPVDGGKIVTAGGGTVITQPTAGTYKAFTAICTHAGCTVGSVSENKITCPCHGSMYSATDGSVLQGPATAPLSPKTITVSGGQIFLAS